MKKQPKIAILRWEQGLVPEGLLQLEQMLGNSTNLGSYPFPVRLVEVKGAGVETVITHPSEKLLSDMIKLSKRLIQEEGIKAISSSCGFNSIFQKQMSEALTVPVFLSSLLQVPYAQSVIGKKKAVGVLTANSASLTIEHFRCCNVTDDVNMVIMGLEEAPEWNKIFDGSNRKLDMHKVTQEITATVRTGLTNHPEIGAIVLECTDLPPYASILRKEFQLPVFDFNSMITHMAMAINEYTNY